MKRHSLVLLMLAFVFMTTCVQAGDDTKDKFEKIKSLAGEWHGKNPAGKPVTVTYEVVSNGSVVMERIQPVDEPDMITMYHLDGDHLMMTHYCSAMNQPRMRATSGGDDENVIRFSLLDVTNLAKPTDGHMQKLVMTFKDKDHLSSQWTFVADGKAEAGGPFELERKKISMK
ncbi:MAG: hypothetical protein V3U73_10470 [bacterium]